MLRCRRRFSLFLGSFVDRSGFWKRHLVGFAGSTLDGISRRRILSVSLSNLIVSLSKEFRHRVEKLDFFVRAGNGLAEIHIARYIDHREGGLFLVEQS